MSNYRVTALVSCPGSARRPSAAEELPSAIAEYELLPWADPYISMLVHRHQAEAHKTRVQQDRASSSNVQHASPFSSMLDRFAI